MANKSVSYPEPPRGYKSVWIIMRWDGTPKGSLKRLYEASNQSSYILSNEEERMMDVLSNTLIDLILAEQKKYLLQNGTPK